MPSICFSVHSIPRIRTFICPLILICVSLPNLPCPIPTLYRRATRYPRDELGRNSFIFVFSAHGNILFIIYHTSTLYPSVYFEISPPSIRGVRCWTNDKHLQHSSWKLITNSLTIHAVVVADFTKGTRKNPCAPRVVDHNPPAQDMDTSPQQ